LLHLVGYLYNCIRDARSQKHPICQSAICWHYYELTLFSTLAGYGLKAKKFSTPLTQLTYNQSHCTQAINLILMLHSLHHHLLFCFTKQKHRQNVTHSPACS